jgi:hypothetical protein
VRPDLSCPVSLLSSITAADFHGRHVAAINAVAQRVQQAAGLMLRFPALDRSTLRLLVCSDASFTNRDDLPSQLGHIVFLADASGSCVFLSWSSHRSRRITRSSMAAETIAFADRFDTVFSLRHEIQRMMNMTVPILMLTDSSGLFEVLTKARRTAEKRLRLSSVRMAPLEVRSSSIPHEEHTVQQQVLTLFPMAGWWSICNARGFQPTNRPGNWHTVVGSSTLPSN